MAVKNKKLKKELEELHDKNKTIDTLVNITSQSKARETLYWTIFIIAAKCSDEFDQAHPNWAKDKRRRKGLEAQAFILAEITRLLDGFKIEYFGDDDSLYGSLYHFDPEKFWEVISDENSS